MTSVSARRHGIDRLGAAIAVLAIAAVVGAIGAGLWTFHVVLNQQSPPRAVCATAASDRYRALLRDEAVLTLRRWRTGLFASRCDPVTDAVAVNFGFQKAASTTTERQIRATLSSAGWAPSGCGQQKVVGGTLMRVEVAVFPDRAVTVGFSDQPCESPASDR